MNVYHTCIYLLFCLHNLGLLPDQVYRVRVLAGTDKGFPVLHDDSWPWVSQRTLSKDSPCTGIDKERAFGAFVF